MKTILFSFFILGLASLMIYIHTHHSSFKLPSPQNASVRTKVATTPRLEKHDYTISYGAKDAPHTLVSFFDMGCTHCATFFKEKFPLIKKTWVENGQLRMVFKPYPIHQETIFFMSCCEDLTEFQKLIFFETMMETENPNIDSMKTAMDILRSPFRVPTSSALKESLLLTTLHEFTALPMMFFDGVVLSDDDQDDLIRFLQEV